MARRSVAECGTDAGYYRHRRRDKTEPCKACLTAHASATRRKEPLPKKTCACGRGMRNDSVQCSACNAAAKRRAGKGGSYTYSEDEHDPKRPVAWVRQGLIMRPVYEQSEVA